jgi:hypothetical protein
MKLFFAYLFTFSVRWIVIHDLVFMIRTLYSKDSHGRYLGRLDEGINGVELGVLDLQADDC